MRIVFISDTHGRHDEVLLPHGDILIHLGDVSPRGKVYEIENFLDWFTEQPHTYKIFIAGNHDFYFEASNTDTIKSKIPDNLIYLNDSGCEIEGIKIWGSPIQPEFFDWAFNQKRGSEIKKHWDLIPNDTDILLTHGPPHGILDKTMQGDLVGCEDLLKKVKLVKPKIHAFGHIHEAYGVFRDDNTKFINASLLNHDYYYTNDAVVVNYK